MMEKPKIYLETTMFNFYYAPDAPGYRVLKGQVHQVFDLIKAGEYEPYTSLYAVGEIDDESNQEKRINMRNLITDYGIKVLEPTDETEWLTALYIKEKAVPESHPTDAAHIAITTVNGLDFIVSLNFTHIARAWTDERVRRVNVRKGYQGIGIYKPAEVLEL